MDIDDAVYREAKAAAALSGRKMKDLVTEGLRWVVRSSNQGKGARSVTAAKKKLSACFAVADELMSEADPAVIARDHLESDRGRSGKK